jgi:hypothetical protein
MDNNKIRDFNKLKIIHEITTLLLSSKRKKFFYYYPTVFSGSRHFVEEFLHEIGFQIDEDRSGVKKTGPDTFQSFFVFKRL